MIEIRAFVVLTCGDQEVTERVPVALQARQSPHPVGIDVLGLDGAVRLQSDRADRWRVVSAAGVVLYEGDIDTSRLQQV